jgi:trimeric autotransporter adhesin
VMIGDAAGVSNTVENDNTFIGNGADGEPGITNATAIGANAKVTVSDSLVLGNNVNVGIGVSNPYARLQVISPHHSGLRVQTDAPHGPVASFGGLGYFMIDAPGSPGGRFFVGEDGKVGVGTIGPSARLEVLDQGNRGLRV